MKCTVLNSSDHCLLQTSIPCAIVPIMLKQFKSMVSVDIEEAPSLFESEECRTMESKCLACLVTQAAQCLTSCALFTIIDLISL